MGKGEFGIVTALTVLVAGAVFVGAVESPDPERFADVRVVPREISVYDRLKEQISPFHFGNVPRESFRGDTTVWVVDLDRNMYTIAQTDLYVTRILRNLGFTSIEAAERAAGGIVFNAVFPNGQPIEINFTCP
ncbi:hypothetical protein CSA37_05745 [Candidatus Fermentibacteria bacterium]|nr:MAG: hypothetical protein CSA37_13215 [Candidatus Fermentibacteria bacterium]PIE52586.1 MAG: hypothetical protein CSA37_05745 [Candidatus Fermentibacteria bacterium]